MVLGSVAWALQGVATPADGKVHGKHAVSVAFGMSSPSCAMEHDSPHRTAPHRSVHGAVWLLLVVAGTVASVCGTGTRWNGSHCVASADPCGHGTAWDAQSGQCVVADEACSTERYLEACRADRGAFAFTCEDSCPGC